MYKRQKRYDPVKTSWLASCVAALLAFGLVFRNLQAVWSSPAMAVPKKDSFRLALAQRLEGWKGVLGQYRYTICHIPGDRNASGDLLSRWVRVPALPVRAVAGFGPCDQDDSMPSKAVVRQAQRKALATDGAEMKSFESAVGLAVLDDEGLFRIHARGTHVL